MRLHWKKVSYGSKKFPKTTAVVHKLIEVDEIAPVKQAGTYPLPHSLSIASGVRVAAWSPAHRVESRW